MAMSRSLGSSWFTTRPPIAISPPLITSSPAIIRSRVDLPQPDGPRITMNSPSPISQSTPWITSRLSYDLRTPLRLTLAIPSPLPASLLRLHQSLDEPSLHHDDHGYGRQHG